MVVSATVSERESANRELVQQRRTKLAVSADQHRVLRLREEVAHERIPLLRLAQPANVGAIGQGERINQRRRLDEGPHPHVHRIAVHEIVELKSKAAALEVRADPFLVSRINSLAHLCIVTAAPDTCRRTLPFEVLVQAVGVLPRCCPVSRKPASLCGKPDAVVTVSQVRSVSESNQNGQ